MIDTEGFGDFLKGIPDPPLTKKTNDEDIIRALVEYADTHPELNVSAYRLVQVLLDIDHILDGRNPRKLLDSMGHLADPAPRDFTDPFHENPCPGCGLEPDVVTYYRRKSDKVRVGYDCSCGAHVIDGVVIHMGAGR